MNQCGYLEWRKNAATDSTPLAQLKQRLRHGNVTIKGNVSFCDSSDHLKDIAWIAFMSFSRQF